MPFSLFYQRCRFCRYFFIGAIVGILAVVALEIIMVLLARDTPAYYAISVIIVYVGGIFASYYGHHRVTFGDIERTQNTANALGRFAIIAVIGLILTTLLSLFFRYAIPVPDVVDKYKPALAFVAAALITSVATFLLNSTFTFSGTQRRTTETDDVNGRHV